MTEPLAFVLNLQHPHNTLDDTAPFDYLLDAKSSKQQLQQPATEEISTGATDHLI